MAYTISQNLNIRPKYFPHVVVHVSAGDANIPVHFSIYDGASPYTIPSGTTITVHGYRKDGGNWIVNGTYSGNVVSFTLPQAAMAIEGAGIADVVFTTGNEVVGSANFCLLVERATFPNGVSYSSDPSVFQDLLNLANGSSIPNAVNDWLSENLSGDVDFSFPTNGTVSPSDYSNSLSRVTAVGGYQIQGSEWTDRPTSGIAGSLLVFRYGTNYVCQLFYEYTGNAPTAYYRIVHRTDYSVYLDWTTMYTPWKRELKSSDDLDDLTGEGVYSWVSASNKPTNAPWTNASMVIVLNQRSTGWFAVQICINTGGADSGIAFRVKNGTTWTDWFFENLSHSRSANGTGIAFLTDLTSEDDLNEITDNGIYYFPDSSIPDNAPDFGYGGVVLVFGSALSTSQKIQMFIGYGADANQGFAYRGLSGENWHKWQYPIIKDSKTGYECSGKKLSILGDSISSYSGYVPTGDGYAAYYNGSNCGVSSVDQMWWKRLIDKTGMVLCKNNSVSGSCLSTGARQDRISGCETARTGALHDGTTNPDYIIVYMGMNDWLNSVDIGSYDGSGTFPTTTNTYREAFAIAMLAIQNNYPNAKVFVCTTQHTESSTEVQTPVLSRNGVTQAEFNEQIREMARLFSCEVIDFEQCGINTGNVSNNTGDGSKLHPNASGQNLLYLEALKHFR